MNSNTAEVIQTGIISVTIAAVLLGLMVVSYDCNKTNKTTDIQEYNIQLERSKAQNEAKSKFLTECASKHTPTECTVMWSSR